MPDSRTLGHPSVVETAVPGTVPATGDAAPPRKIYRIGTLRYTLTGLVNLFVWLLWGDFCYMMLEAVIPRLLPLYLNDLHVSNRLIGILVGSVPGVISLTLLPIFSVRSDRHRGRWGRRRPFLLWTSPLAAGCLILIGFCYEIGTGPAAILGRFLALSRTGTILAALCVFVVLFHLFNIFMSAMYNCLVVDVVPPEVMNRFLSLFRTVGTLGGFLFARYLFPLGQTHRRAIFLGVGLVYLATFLLMCWRVREGEYPPPQAPGAGTPGRWAATKAYFKECFSADLYRYFFLMNALYTLTGCMMPFYIFFYRDNLHLSLDEIGTLIGWVYLLIALACLPMGYVCDWLHPVRLTPVALSMVLGGAVAALLLIHDKLSLYLVMLPGVVPGAALAVAFTASAVALLPRARYAQFNSAMSLTGAGFMIVANALAGNFIDFFGNYRAVWLWYILFDALSLTMAVLVYREWKRCGGPDHYVPPNSREG